MKKFLEKTISIMLIIFMISAYSSISIAATLSDLQDEQSSISDEISDTEEVLEGLEDEMTETLEQVESLIAQISGYESEIEDLEEQISELQEQINEAEEQIKQDEEDYAEEEEALDARLVAMYKTGTTSYLDFLLSSSSLIDFISSYYLISQVTEYDTKMLEQLEEHKNKIEEEKAELEASKAELEEAEETLVSKKETLEATKKEKEEYVDQLSEEEKATEEKLQELQDANDDLNAQIKKKKAEIAAAQAAAATSSSSSSSSSAASSASTTTSSSGFIWPLMTKYHTITATWYYSSGAFHGGTDISGSGVYGSPIYAVEDGYVVLSGAQTNSSGSYIGYGNYVIIAHYDGLYTLYGHMSSRAVSTGDTVTQGQVIGYVGSTGNSTGPHLHFEVRTGNGTSSERVNPLSYLPSV